MYEPEELHARCRTEQVWVRLLLKLLALMVQHSPLYASYAQAVLGALMRGYRYAPSWRELNHNLNEVAHELDKLRSFVEHRPIMECTSLLLDFQRRYLRDVPDYVLRQQQPTRADLEDWYSAVNETIKKYWADPLQFL